LLVVQVTWEFQVFIGLDWILQLTGRNAPDPLHDDERNAK